MFHFYPTRMKAFKTCPEVVQKYLAEMKSLEDDYSSHFTCMQLYNSSSTTTVEVKDTYLRASSHFVPLSSFGSWKYIAYILLGILEVSVVERLSLSQRVLYSVNYYDTPVVAVIHTSDLWPKVQATHWLIDSSSKSKLNPEHLNIVLGYFCWSLLK